LLLKLRHKKAPWITTIDQHKQSISKIYLSLLHQVSNRLF